MFTRHVNAFLSFCLIAGAAGTAQAARVEGTDTWAAERFQIRGRLITVAPDESSSTTAGGEVNVGDGMMPEVDLSYYFTDNVAVEVIASTTQHSLSHNALGDLGRTWVLPPTVTLQYHFTPNNSFSPYVGAGLNYSIFYGEEAAGGNGINDLELEGGIGYALQAGADYWIDNNWGVNFDVKKLFLNVDGSVNNGAVRADVDLDPWVIGAGVSYRF